MTPAVGVRAKARISQSETHMVPFSGNTGMKTCPDALLKYNSEIEDPVHRESDVGSYFGELLVEKRENPEGSYLLKFLDLEIKSASTYVAGLRLNGYYPSTRMASAP